MDQMRIVYVYSNNNVTLNSLYFIMKKKRATAILALAFLWVFLL